MSMLYNLLVILSSLSIFLYLFKLVYFGETTSHIYNLKPFCLI